MTVTWAEEQPDPTTIVVRFRASIDGDTDHEELAHTWQHFQSSAYGVAAAPLPVLPPAPVAEAADDVTQSPERTRLLSLSEAFYLLTADTKWLAAPESFGSHEQIWRRFSSASALNQQRFQRHFVVQFHFRQLGWVLKSGLNYGGHYVLYRGAANEFHSEYIVYVKEPREQLPWGVVQALTRVAADVKKTVLVCDVACEELTSMDGVGRSTTTTGTSSTLTEGKYAFYDQEFHFMAVAIRFWDVAGSDSQRGEQQQSFAFQLQPVLLKKKPRKKSSIGKRAWSDKL